MVPCQLVKILVVSHHNFIGHLVDFEQPQRDAISEHSLLVTAHQFGILKRLQGGQQLELRIFIALGKSWGNHYLETLKNVVLRDAVREE